jgi:RNA polymerase sigma-70 factor, ECF subfamily
MRAGNKFSFCCDEELMSMVRAGEVAAFDEIYLRYSKRLLAYFTRMLNFNKNLAEDALQDLFLKIAERPELFDTKRSFRTWIFSSASNSCKNYYRHLKVVKESAAELYDDQPETDGDFVKLASAIDAKAFMVTLDKTLNELPMEKKEAFILKYQEHKTISEIALIQDCPEGSVKSRLHYAVKFLENRLRIYNPIN